MTNNVSAQVNTTLLEKGIFSGKTLFTKFLILIDKICHFIGSTFQYLSSMVSFSKKDFNTSLESAEISLVDITSQLDKEEPKIDLSPKIPLSNDLNRLDKVVCHLPPNPKPVSVEKLPELHEKEPTPKKDPEITPTEKKEDICEELDSNPKEETEKTQTSLLLDVVRFIGSSSILAHCFMSQGKFFEPGNSSTTETPKTTDTTDIIDTTNTTNTTDIIETTETTNTTDPLSSLSNLTAEIVTNAAIVEAITLASKELRNSATKVIENSSSENLGTFAAGILNNNNSTANPIQEVISSEDNSYFQLSASTIGFGVLAALSLALITYKVFSTKKESETELDLEKSIFSPNLQPSDLEPPKQESLYPDLSLNNNRTAPTCTGQYAPSAPDIDANLPSAPPLPQYIPPTETTNRYSRKCLSINNLGPDWNSYGVITPIQELHPLRKKKKSCIYPKKAYNYLKNSCISREKAYSHLKTAAHYLSHQEVYIPLATTAAISSLIGVKNTFKVMYWTGVGITYIPQALYYCYQYPIIPIAIGATSFGVFHGLANLEKSFKKAR